MQCGGEIEGDADMEDAQTMLRKGAGSAFAGNLDRQRGQEALRGWIQRYCNLRVPQVRVCKHHSSVMDYVWHCFTADYRADVSNGDSVVWACRGGSKTLMGAVLTLLDCVFKDGCEVRILGGSLEQSQRMYGYLLGFLEGELAGKLSGRPRSGRCVFANGSAAEVLSQSSRSVRGSHVHKLRCDEVELFDRKVFEAAKYITRSEGGIKAGMEMASTMHRPWGLMYETVNWARSNDVPVFSWCVWEVIESCRDRECSRCPLWGHCKGRAKRSDGFLLVDDVITQMRRSSRSGFESEMLCLRPSSERAVFRDFNADIHVCEVGFDSNLPIYLAVDFGFVHPFVCLFLQTDGEGQVRVVHEYAQRYRRVSEHVRSILNVLDRHNRAATKMYCDPAGASRNDVSGTSPVSVMRKMGLRVSYRASRILEGVELIRRALRSGEGRSRLRIDRSCRGLIRAMEGYHYPEEAADPEIPLKDGVHDHYIDALRYFFVNFEGRGYGFVDKIY